MDCLSGYTDYKDATWRIDLHICGLTGPSTMG